VLAVRHGQQHRGSITDSEPSAGLGELVRMMLKRHPAFSANPIGDWADIAGVQVAHHSAPKELKNGCLLVICHDSIWKHHLEMTREQLLIEINRGRSQPLVERIKFKIGELPEADQPVNPNHRLLAKMVPKRLRRSHPKLPKRPLTDAEEELLRKLPDKELRAMARRILSRTPVEE